MTIKQKDIWIIIPCFNEANRLKLVVDRVYPEHPNIILVDDGSTDHTQKIINTLPVTHLRHRVNLGKGAALTTGSIYAFNYKRAKAVIFMDGDNQHDPDDLKKFIQSLQNYDVTFGIRRHNRPMPPYKRALNALSSTILQLVFGTHIPDIPSGFKALTKKGYETVQWEARGYEVEMEIAARVAKNKVAFNTVPIATHYHGKDHGMTLMDVIKMSWYFAKLRISL